MALGVASVGLFGLSLVEQYAALALHIQLITGKIAVVFIALIFLLLFLLGLYFSVLFFQRTVLQIRTRI